MRTFSLDLEGKSCVFDTDGKVHDASADIVGTWTTTAQNKIKVTKTLGGTVEVAVAWGFNASNQLTISEGGKLKIALNNTTDGLPRLQLKKNVLIVDPDGDGDFEFPLQCLFGMKPDGNLVVSINGSESVLDGYLEDSKSQLCFVFFDKALANFPNSLVFSGAWERKGKDSEIRLHFVLEDPAMEITAKPLDLPAVVKVDPHTNHLVMQYNSKYGDRQISFLGSFQIKPGWKLEFRIADVKETGLRKSTIEVNTTFEWDSVQGKLALYVGKTRTQNSQVIEVGGSLSATLKNGVTLNWDFAYKKSTAGGQSVTTIATAVEFVWKSGKVNIRYTQDGQTKTLDIEAKLVQTNYVLTGGLSIANDPQGRRLGAFIGVSW